MASNWRQLIADCGMYQSNWRLAARYVDDPDVLLVGLLPFGTTMAEVWYWAGPGQLPVKLGTRLIDPDEHFPYGDDVLPD